MPSKQASWFANVNPNVFLGTVIIIALFLAVVVIAPSSFELLTQQLKQWITDSFLCTRQISQNPYPIRVLPS
ncbi:hypothetical protein ACP3QQ_04075, partial [Acinetobacter baumannii]|uniref:hypothetical protein n=2 Tax=Acinetobacter baumannii TaxID=470 RepID=UPI003ED9BFAF